MFNIYCSSFYGSNLWNLFGKNCERVYTARNNACRLTFNVPRTTHRYLIETFSKCQHPKVFLYSRFLKYHETLTKCNKPAVRGLANLFKSDLRTVYGNNLHKISVECGSNIDQLSAWTIKDKMTYFKVPEHEKWRQEFIGELLDVGTLKTFQLGTYVWYVEH